MFLMLLVWTGPYIVAALPSVIIYKQMPGGLTASSAFNFRYWFPYIQACNISSKRMWWQLVKTICRMADNVPWQVSSGLHEETTFR